MKKLCRFAVWLIALSPISGQGAENVILITLDGLRWEELFQGADRSLIDDAAFTEDAARVEQAYWRDSPEQRRQALMPFFWTTISKQGLLLGNRNLGSTVTVRNREWFSYPGYNELLSGAADPSITSNDKVANQNTTVLEWVNQQPGFMGRVAAFASWDVFPYIINEARSGVPVNAGFRVADDPKTLREAWLNELQTQTPSPWTSVRLDVFTHHFAMEHLRHSGPRLIYIGYGETDDFAHDGEYHHYLDAAHRADGFIRDLWQFVQTDPRYRGKTTLVITTDHGRGSGPRWTDHASDVVGAEAIWVALLGDGVPALGEATNMTPAHQDQVAATVAALLGLDFTAGRAVGAPLGLGF